MNDSILSHIDSITPFYFVLERDGTVLAAGKTFLLTHPDLINNNFNSYFYLEGEELLTISFNTLIRLSDVKLNLKSKLINNFKTEGQFYYITNSNSIYFIGVPDIFTYQYLAKMGLPITHYWRYLEEPDIIPIFRNRSDMIDSFFKMNNLINIQRKELEYEKLKYVEILDSIEEIVFQVDPQGNFVFINKVWQKIMGYSIEETLGVPFFKFVFQNDLLEAYKDFNEIINKRQDLTNRKRRYKTKSNELKWLRVNAKKLFNDKGELIGTVGTYLDITNEIIAERKLEFITNNIIDELTMFDVDGNYQYASPSAYLNRGFSSFEEMCKTNAYELIDNDTRLKGLQSIREKGFINWEGKFKLPSGEEKWYQVTSRIIYDQIANKEQIIVVSRNIEERKKAEQHIEIALAKEQELNKLRSDFISTTTHEFKTPLVVIKSSIESLMRSKAIKKGNAIHPEIHKQLTSIDAEADRLVHLITDTLLLESAQNNLLNPVFELTDIVYLIINTAERHNNYNPNKKLRVNASIMPPNIAVDPKLMGYVFDNLITNALKYSTDKPVPEINISHNDQYITVIVKDNGIGIPVEDFTKLFTPFFRAANTRGISGTGMGLCIVKKILDVHDGNIYISSKLNVGTTVKIEIPFNLLKRD